MFGAREETLSVPRKFFFLSNMLLLRKLYDVCTKQRRSEIISCSMPL